MKKNLIKITVVVIISMIAISASVEAITTYESYNAISVGGKGIGGVEGIISITSPKINAKDLKGHKDYMVYIYLQDQISNTRGSIGAGWIAYKDNTNTMKKASLVYVNDRDLGVAMHDIVLDVSSRSTISPYIVKILTITVGLHLLMDGHVLGVLTLA
jgi:hypothetical protein